MRSIGCVTLLAVLCCSSLAEANPWRNFWATCKANQCWPAPYNYADRTAATMPFAIMVENGWRMQNMLGEYHFRPDDQQLTEAGRLKVYWIAVEGPAAHRTVFVPRAATPEITQMRMAAVRSSLEGMHLDFAFDVQETGLAPPAWPADYIDSIERKYRETTPQPRLPKFENAGSVQ
ncbi:MAG: hypothetical protein K1X74_21555 [Pirellulales bacterium]|nr:hypothetical protein [Pirellulales bacterium]